MRTLLALSHNSLASLLLSLLWASPVCYLICTARIKVDPCTLDGTAAVVAIQFLNLTVHSGVFTEFAKIFTAQKQNKALKELMGPEWDSAYIILSKGLTGAGINLLLCVLTVLMQWILRDVQHEYAMIGETCFAVVLICLAGVQIISCSIIRFKLGSLSLEALCMELKGIYGKKL